MVKFEIKSVVRRNNKNMRATESLLNLLQKIVPSYVGYYVSIEFDREGKASFTKRWFDNGWHSVDL